MELRQKTGFGESVLPQVGFFAITICTKFKKFLADIYRGLIIHRLENNIGFESDISE